MSFAKAGRVSATRLTLSGAIEEQQLGAQQADAASFLDFRRISSDPYPRLPPVVRNVSQETPCGSSIQLFSLCA